MDAAEWEKGRLVEGLLRSLRASIGASKTGSAWSLLYCRSVKHSRYGRAPDSTVLNKIIIKLQVILTCPKV